MKDNNEQIENKISARIEPSRLDFVGAALKFSCNDKNTLDIYGDSAAISCWRTWFYINVKEALLYLFRCDSTTTCGQRLQIN